MNVYVNVKSIGKRKNALDKVPYTLPSNITTLYELITAIVNIEAERYNSKQKEALILPYLTKSEIENQGISGKIGFGSIYSDKKANIEKDIQKITDSYVASLDKLLVKKENEIMEI